MKRSKKQPAVAVPATPLLPPSRRWPVVTAMLVGFVIWALLWGFQDVRSAPALQFNLGPARWTLAVLATAIAALPPVARFLTVLADLLSGQLARRPGMTALVVMLVATSYLILTAHLQGRDLFPKTHDDQSYLIQMQMLARFRLWMPQHPLADFFDTFYVISRPVYASLYFPGTALLYVPTIWLDLPHWLLPSAVAGGCTGLMYAIFRQLLNPIAGVVAAMAVLSLDYFRIYSMLLTSHEPMLLMGLLMTWAWLRWRGSPNRMRWELLLGVFAGWGAITRPADALCFAIPIGVAMLLDLARSDRSTAAKGFGVKRLSRVTVCVVAGAVPFFALQAIFNKGVTGSWLQTPYTYYLNSDQPNTSFGFHPYNPIARPASSLQQKQDYYDQFFSRYILRHQPVESLQWWARVYLPMIIDTALPTRMAVPLVCVGLLAILRDRRRWAVVLTLPLFLVTYWFNVFFLEHYAIQVIPAFLLLVVLGIRGVATAWPEQAVSIRAGLSAGFLSICLLILPEFNPFWSDRHQVSDETFTSKFMRAAKQEFPEASDLKKPAVILFSYRFGDPLVEDPVYNTDVAWPDDAPVIYARDLGPRNQEIFDYYAKHQPTRHFYRFDRNSAEKIQDLGSAVDLARK